MQFASVYANTHFYNKNKFLLGQGYNNKFYMMMKNYD